ncbi:MAG: NAD(+)/NADH kinase [Clostridium sp.]|nr:NAD(+)/NADH kinase [Clostridium sp.]MCM1399421.1 NAD(+)/NADH kinase [Clostridium sp.]MCM1459975.1 NAD(+)/NADH kinase [Bacteroides sp.]
MNHFLIFTNTDKDLGLELSNKITEYIKSRGGTASIVRDFIEDSGEKKDSFLDGVQAVIVLGGDGTMLRAARAIGEYDIPLIGINLGTLGFLTEVEKSNVFRALDRLFCDNYIIENRIMIEGTINGKTFHSLNDIVITRAGFSRVIGLNVYVNGQLLDTYEADGIIVATPTGSTGYNLSAGGPIISPKSRVIVVTPISPHSLTSKSIVFDCLDEIKIEIIKKRKTQDTEAIVSFDGENSIGLGTGDIVTACTSSRTLRLIKMYDVNFYSVLRDKIGG